MVMKRAPLWLEAMPLGRAARRRRRKFIVALLLTALLIAVATYPF